MRDKRQRLWLACLAVAGAVAFVPHAVGGEVSAERLPPVVTLQLTYDGTNVNRSYGDTHRAVEMTEAGREFLNTYAQATNGVLYVAVVGADSFPVLRLAEVVAELRQWWHGAIEIGVSSKPLPHEARRISILLNATNCVRTEWLHVEE
jgi:hypothetical protein